MITLFTDTDTDITLKEANELGYKLISMPYIVDGKEIKPYEDFEEFKSKEFYDMLRSGVIPKTCAISPIVYKEYFEPEFAKGNDILYVHFSKAMSGTFNAMHIAVEELKEKYPERKFYSIDTKAITICSLNIVKEVADMFKEGKNIEEILEWAEKEVDHFAQYFFADDLKFFRRSGRISNFSGVMGNLIGVKPIICMDKDGMMTNIAKERGRSNALNRLVKYMEELGENVKEHRIIIGHSDALDLAIELEKRIKEKFGDDLKIEYAVVNPTAGSHCGPDAVGVTFHSKSR